MFSNFFLRSFRVFLLPFALLYWLGILFRNFLYDVGILKTSSFGLPLICVGNLSVGGTGKSPMVEYIVELLRPAFKVAIVSRGYMRKTRGYALADEDSTALEIGDEPMQFALKFPDVSVAVGEERIVAIPQLLHDRPDIEAIVLDDAFQHRAINAGLNILLTDYPNLFTRDFYLPTGDLRDLKSSYKRAQVIVVTKCDPSLDETERQKLVKEIRPLAGQEIFFTATEYGMPYHIRTRLTYELNEKAEVLLVTGIANPRPLKSLLEERARAYYLQQYRDHHIFSIDDLQEIRKKFRQIESVEKIILTTEKDAVRLMKFHEDLGDLPLYVIPVRHYFLFGDAKKFNELVASFVRNFGQTKQPIAWEEKTQKR